MSFFARRKSFGGASKKNDSGSSSSSSSTSTSTSGGESATDQRAFVKLFHRLPEATNDVVRFFDRRSYYTVHGDDALFVAQEFLKTKADLKMYDDGGEKLPSQNLPTHVFQSILKSLLFEHRRRFEIYSLRNGKLKLDRKGSPGNLQEVEDLLFTNSDLSESTSIVSVRFRQDGSRTLVSFAQADVTLWKMSVAEFQDTDQLSNFEAAIVQAGARECLMPIKLDENKKPTEPIIKKAMLILEKCGVAVTAANRDAFKATDIEQDLARLVGSLSDNLAEIEMKGAMGSLSCLIKYLDLLNNSSYEGRFRLRSFDLTTYMRLDAAAVDALTLVPTKREGSKRMNLYSLLNHCRTAMGSRLLHQWIHQPLLDVDAIRQRQDLVELLVGDDQLRTSLHEVLRQFPDLTRLAKKFHRGKATLEDCVRLYTAVGALPDVIDQFRDALRREPEHAGAQLAKLTFNEPLIKIGNTFEPFLTLIEETVDLGAAAESEYIIKANFSEDLANLYTQKDELRHSIVKLFNGLEKRHSLPKSFKLENDSKTGWYLKVSRNDEKTLRKKKPFEYSVIQTLTGGVKFTTSKLERLSQQFVSVCAEYDELQMVLVRDLLEVVTSYMDLVEDLGAVIAEVDVIVSMGEAAASGAGTYVRPTVTPLGEGDIVLRQSRHPCLEAQDDVHFIPNDVELRRGQSSFVIVTGPNMGGKSTFIRQAGLICLMAQMGCFVPCEEATVSVTDCILARVGAGDSQLRGVSTFMAEMLETATILAKASRNSLVIIDELGRGTSTYDGFGLAWSISEHISTKIDCFCLFATHFHELTALADEVPHVDNRHVTALAQDGKLTLLYRVREGPCDRSFGIHVAEMANFPNKVVEAAKRKVIELESGSLADTSSKRRKVDAEAVGISAEVEQSGRQSIERFMEKFYALPMDELDDEAVLERVSGLTRELDPQSNEFVRHVLEAPPVSS